MRRHPLLSAIAIIALSSPSTVVAQGEPESIPTILAQTLPNLFGSMFDDAPRFTVGHLPRGWPARLVPPKELAVVGGTVVGTVRSIVVRQSRLAPPGALDRLIRNAGFRLTDSVARPAAHGFVGPELSPDFPGTLWCGDSSRALMVRPVDSTASTRRLVVTLLPRMGGTWCGRGGQDYSARDRGAVLAKLRVPLLSPPRGAAINGAGTSWSSTKFELDATADDALSPRVLADHYSAQLGRAGWTLVGGTVATGGVAARALRTRDDEGVDWSGAITVVTVGNRREIRIQMASAEGR